MQPHKCLLFHCSNVFLPFSPEKLGCRVLPPAACQGREHETRCRGTSFSLVPGALQQDLLHTVAVINPGVQVLPGVPGVPFLVPDPRDSTATVQPNTSAERPNLPEPGLPLPDHNLKQSANFGLRVEEGPSAGTKAEQQAP